MTEPSQPPTPVPVDPASVRVVLFGMPNAGKTSLLAAFVQALEKQPRVLQLHVRDLPAALKAIQQQVYEATARETQEEIVAYPLKVDPPGAPPPFPAVLYDCDGRVANELLSKKKFLEASEVKAGLARAILDADALVLVVDVSANELLIDSHFREFKRFLKLLEQNRARGHEVGGLPVFLVLSKCDRLADESMTLHQWHEHIEERKRAVMNRFAEFMRSSENEEPFFAFGSLDLDVAATAIRAPELKRTPSHANEPMGVAELFHDCLIEAARYHNRALHARKRLVWIVGLAASFLSLLAIGAVVFAFYATYRPPQLVGKIESYRAREGQTAAIRLSVQSGLDNRLGELTGFVQDPGFAMLPEEKQAFVRERKAELEAYLKLSDDLRGMTKPRQARSLPELDRIEDGLKKRGAVPDAYQKEWESTEAVQFRERLLKEVPTLRNAVSDLRSFYLKLKARGTEILFAPEIHAEWDRQLREFLVEAEKPPVPDSDVLKRNAFDFDETIAAVKDWGEVRAKLERLRELCVALGIVGDPAGPEAPLALFEPPTDADINKLATERLQNLRTHYPDRSAWSLAALPDPVRPQITTRVRRSLEQSIRDGQRLILAQLHVHNPKGPEKPSDWASIAEWIVSPSVQSWRELTTTLARLLDPVAEEPAAAFAAFLKRSGFDIELRKLQVRIPNNLREARLRPNGKLNVYLQPRGKDAVSTTLSFNQAGEPQRDNQGAMIYTFQLEGGDAHIDYRPGDTLWADLRLKEGDRDWQFTWWRWRSRTYQFDSLAREPRLHEPQRDSGAGDIADGVAITVIDGKLPVLPALMPTVTFAR